MTALASLGFDYEHVSLAARMKESANIPATAAFALPFIRAEPLRFPVHVSRTWMAVEDSRCFALSGLPAYGGGFPRAAVSLAGLALPCQLG